MEKVLKNCLFFNGYKPCKYHKLFGNKCKNCEEYKSIDFRVLILKVGAAGEVIRNTPILRKIKNIYEKENKNVEISWITDYPDLVPKSYVNRILKYDWKNVQMILAEKFDLLINLDKDHDVCALAKNIKAEEKKGFILDKNGKVIPANINAREKWYTGIYDDIMRRNKKHYVEEIFNICGWKWEGEKYIIDDYIEPKIKFKKGSNYLIGLNTGAGNRWKTRIWPEKKWLSLIEKLIDKKYQVLLLGGPEEHKKNIKLMKITGAYYEGVKSMKEFIGLVNYCDIIVTAVTLTFHIAIGLEKKIILFNNVFNKSEFYLYGLGKILEPNIDCKACYKDMFDDNCKVDNCMDLIEVKDVFDNIEKQLKGN